MSAPFFLRAREPVGRFVRGAAGRAPAPSLARLRAAVAALFALDGFVFGTWAARVPDVAARVGADHSTLGLALLCLSLGALACMQLTGALAARLGPGLVAALAAVAVCATAVLPGLAASVPALCAALLAFGAATGAVNVAANSVGVQVEARAGRPVLSGLHAAFSFGGLGGALLAGWPRPSSPSRRTWSWWPGPGCCSPRCSYRCWSVPTPPPSSRRPRTRTRPAGVRPPSWWCWAASPAPPPTARARSPTGVRCTCARTSVRPRGWPPRGTPGSPWRWRAGGWPVARWSRGWGSSACWSAGRCWPRPAPCSR